MASSQSDSSKHHFVPRSLLRYFMASGPDEYMFTFDKRSRKCFRASLMNTGSQNDYNCLRQGDEFVNFEKEFDAADSMLAARLKEIHALKMGAMRTTQQRADWIDLVAVQLLRSPIVRSSHCSAVAQLKTSIENAFGKQVSIPIPTDNDSRIVARSLFHERTSIRKSLANKDFILFEAAGPELFRISDRPVCVDNADPYGDCGLSSPSVTIFMPLGPRLLLGLFSPNLRHRLNRYPIEELGHPADHGNLLALREAFSTGTTIQWGSIEVGRHNAHQVAHASRFIYGPTEDFSDVVALMDANPGIREVNSSISVGRMGEGPGPQDEMPPGRWLVLIGKLDSHMLPVEDLVQDWPVEAIVTSEEVLAIALADGPFSELRYYDDRYQLTSLRDVVVERSAADQRKVIIRHRDESLNALMSMLQGERTPRK